MKNVHTPGPWKVIAPTPRELWDARIFAGTRYIGMIGNSDNHDGCDEGNARLIAAAPDLLEALEHFAKFACETPHVNEPDCYNCRARAAIAKATGREV